LRHSAILRGGGLLAFVPANPIEFMQRFEHESWNIETEYGNKYF